MSDLTFIDLDKNKAVDLNPETVETYRTEIEWYAQTRDIDLAGLYGRFLVVTPEGPNVLDVHEFHELWAFYTPTRADRTTLRTIISRKK